MPDTHIQAKLVLVTLKFNPNRHKKSRRTRKEPQYIIIQQFNRALRQLQQSNRKYIFLFCEQADSQHIKVFSSLPSSQKTLDLWLLVANSCLGLKSKSKLSICSSFRLMGKLTRQQITKAQFLRVMGSFEVRFSRSQEQADFQAIWASFTEVFEEDNGFHL